MEIFGSASYADLMNLDITTYLFTSSPNYISAFPTGGFENGDRGTGRGHTLTAVKSVPTKVDQ